MNKIEEMLSENHGLHTSYSVKNKDGHFESVVSVKSAAEITEQIAIEFAEWCNTPNLEDIRQGNVVYVPSGNFYWHNHKKYTPKELFQEFLKTKRVDVDTRPNVSSPYEKGFVIDNPNYNKIITPKEEQKQLLIDIMKGDEELGLYDEPKQIKCYCGHTTYCDCSPLEKPKQETIEEAAEQFEYTDGIYGFKQGVKWQMDKQDDFIIGFLEFIEGTYDYSNIHDHWYLNADTSKTYTKKALLKKYNDTLNGN